MADLLPIDEALRRVLERARPLETEAVDVADAAGRVLAEPALSAVDLPPFDSSAMDGYTLRAADTPGDLPVVERIAAGRPRAARSRRARRWRSPRAARCPAAPTRWCRSRSSPRRTASCTCAEAVAAGAHVRPRGGDLRQGETIVDAGVVLGARARRGARRGRRGPAARSARRPRVGRPHDGHRAAPARDAELEPGQIYDANGPMLAALVRSAGGEPAQLQAVADDEEAHRDALRRGLEHDVLVSSGGVSVGPHDLVRGVGAELGVEEVFWRIAMRPGKPLWFGVRGDTLVFGLPGNPVSSLVCFELFVRPALLALQGHRVARAAVRARDAGRDRCGGTPRATTSSARAGDGADARARHGQESHMIARAAEADALVLVPRGEGELTAGDTVQFLRI